MVQLLWGKYWIFMSYFYCRWRMKTSIVVKGFQTCIIFLPWEGKNSHHIENSCIEMKHLLQFQMENVSENHFHPLKIFSISLSLLWCHPLPGLFWASGTESQKRSKSWVALEILKNLYKIQPSAFCSMPNWSQFGLLFLFSRLCAQSYKSSLIWAFLWLSLYTLDGKSPHIHLGSENFGVDLGM